VAKTEDVHIEPLRSDLVALAQCHALGATVFPGPSMPAILGPDRVLVARRAAREPVVGFVAVASQGPLLDVTALAVDPAHRGAGLGRALLSAAIDLARARGHDGVSLHVSTANPVARALYESAGFEVARHIRGFYSARHFGDGGDALLMLLAPL
jgi:ribosomal protein S18 acetylase RimI-like enzyme